MAASSRGFTAPIGAKLDVSPSAYYYYRNNGGFVEFRRKKRKLISNIKCCCSDSAMPINSGNGVDKSGGGEDWRFDAKKISANYMRIQASSSMPFPSPQ